LISAPHEQGFELKWSVTPRLLFWARRKHRYFGLFKLPKILAGPILVRTGLALGIFVWIAQPFSRRSGRFEHKSSILNRKTGPFKRAAHGKNFPTST
jgi:hypothetical protein